MLKRFRIGFLVTAIILVAWLLPSCNFVPSVIPVAKSPVKIDEAWNLIFNNYVEKEKLISDNLSESAIRGMLDAINDPYTSYLNPQDFELSRSSFQGELEGIGAQVGVREGKLVIIAPLPDTPAERAGIRAGDTILAIDGQPASELSPGTAILKIRGPKGTKVALQVLHEEETVPVDIEITRDVITVTSVRFEMVDGMAYISIRSFAEETGQEIGKIIPELSKQGATGIILDLRGNPGGLLNTVTDVASYFLHEGVVVKVKDNQGQMTEYEVKPTGEVTDLPMVVLVDDASASGSEVLGGALQDYKRAILAGSTTFGKGSVNQFFPLSDGSGLYLTIARWYTPLGRPIEGVGLEPDVKLELTGEDAVHWAVEHLRGNKAAPTGATYFSEALAVTG